MAHKFMRKNCDQSISRYNICAIVCPAYAKSLSLEILQSTFRRPGIFLFNPNAVLSSNFKLSRVIEQKVSVSSCSPVNEKKKRFCLLRKAQFFKVRFSPERKRF